MSFVVYFACMTHLCFIDTSDIYVCMIVFLKQQTCLGSIVSSRGSFRKLSRVGGTKVDG